MTWFNGLVCAAVLLILCASAGTAMMGLQEFDALSVAGSIFLLLLLPVLYKLASRRPKPRRR